MKVIPLSISKANQFVIQFHRHNGRTSRNGGKFAIGAYDDDLGLIGVAIVGNPIARNLMDGFTVEVLRTCTRPDAPKNTNSFLYGACRRIWQAMGGKKIITYTLQKESGASLRGAGWEPVAEVKPSSGWSRPGVGRRRDYQTIYAEPKTRWEASASLDQR